MIVVYNYYCTLCKHNDHSCLPSVILSTQSLASSAVSACRTSMQSEKAMTNVVGLLTSSYSTFSTLVRGKLRLTFSCHIIMENKF